ncbi:MAG: hypothetical protein J0H88_08295 [Sphingomonadales bacterium]|nr:hypothetical protein [Sphingomonadales bacterium]
MRIATDRLIVKALTALEEVSHEARRAPIAPSHALRFALAFLYAHSDGRRDSFDSFWRVVTDAGDHGQPTENLVNVVRSNYASRELHGIYRSVGVHRSTDMIYSWSKIRPPGKTHTPDGNLICEATSPTTQDPQVGTISEFPV